MSTESLLANSVSQQPNIFFVHEEAEQAYRVDEFPFVVSLTDTLESSCRQLCQRLKIPPLSSYLFSCCVYPHLNKNVRRWLPPGEPPPKGVKGEFRLCCLHFSPRQLANLSESALHYYFLCVKFDLLRQARLCLKNSETGLLHKLVASLLSLDLCRILAKHALITQDAVLYEDLVTSLVKAYEKLLFGLPCKFNLMERMSKKFLWRKAPELLQRENLPDLMSKIRGKHWTEFAIAYLEALENACPDLRANRYALRGGALSIDLGANGLALRSSFSVTHKLCEVGALVSATLSAHTIQLVIIDGASKVLEFENPSDARSFAIELSSYYRILRCFTRPLFDASTTDQPGIIGSVQLWQRSNQCWGPLSESSDVCSVFEASTLLRRHAQYDAIAFESAATYGLIGIYVVRRDSAGESVRWFKLCVKTVAHDICLRDSHTNAEYQSVEDAVAAQLKELTSPHEADNFKSIQPRLLFDEATVLRPFVLVRNDLL